MPDPRYPIPLAAARNPVANPSWDHYAMWADKLPARPSVLSRVDRRAMPGASLTVPKRLSAVGPSPMAMEAQRKQLQEEERAKQSAASAARRDQIVAGMDTVAPFVSNVINSFRRAPRPMAPRPYQYMKLRPVNYNASRTEAARAVYGANQGAGLLDENTAAAVRTGNLTQGIRAVNAVNEQEANQNTMISNQAAQVNTQIDNAYTDNLNRYDDANVNARMADMQQQSGNLANAADKYVAIRNQMRMAELEGQKYQILSDLYKDSGVLERFVDGYRRDPKTGIPVFTQKKYGGKLRYTAGGMLRKVH